MTLESLKAKLLSNPKTKEHYDELTPEFDEAKKTIMENRSMKKLIVEYLGYKLEVEIKPSAPGSNSKGYPYIKGTCESLNSFVKSGYYENYLPIMEEFMRYTDVVVDNTKK